MLDETLRPVSESALRELAQRQATYEALAGEQVTRYLTGQRAIPEGVWRAAGVGFVGDSPLPGDERFRNHLSIPYGLGSGEPISIRFRNLTGSGSKYSCRSGERTVMYRPWAVFGQMVAHIAEGELDCLSLVSAGLDASCGLPGAQSWKPWYQALFEGADTVFVWADGDDAGDEMFQKIAGSLPQAVRVHVPRGLDVNSVLVGGGAQAVTGLLPEWARP